MPAPRNYQTEAVILKKTKLGEADSILTFYTPHLGKIQGFAKSLRKPRSKLAGHLELLTHSLVSFARGRNLDTITGSQTITSFLALKNDLTLSSQGLYVTELVDQFTAGHIENYALFRLLLDTLERLGSEANRELVLRFFEFHVLKESGYLPELRHCVSCRKVLEPEGNYFSPPDGGLLCADCAPGHPLTYPITANAIKVLRLIQAGDFQTVSRLKLNEAISSELEGLMRLYIRYLLEREVRSTAWLDALRR